MAGNRAFRVTQQVATGWLNPKSKPQQFARGLHGKHVDGKDLTVLVAQEVARMRITNEQITPRIEEEMGVTHWLEAEYFHERGDFFTLRPHPDDKRLGHRDAWTCGIIHKTDEESIILKQLIRPRPAIQILQRCGRCEADSTGTKPECVAVEAREGDFDDSLSFVIEDYFVLHSGPETW